MMRYTLKGFEIIVLGQSERAGRFAGFSSTQDDLVFSMLFSGALAGLAGISRGSAARSASCARSISPGYGFTAIIVAFLGRLNPLGIVASGLVLALTYLGGEAAQLSLGVSDKVTRVFQGLLLFFVLSCDTLIHYKIRLVWSRLTGTARKEPHDGYLRSHSADGHHRLDAAGHRRPRRTGDGALRRAQSRCRGHDGHGCGLRLCRARR